MATTKQEYDAVRINFLDSSDARGTSASYDARFLNGFFDPVYNKVKQDIEYFFTKRPGTGAGMIPSPTGGSAAIGRGIFAPSSAFSTPLFSVFGNKLYRGTQPLSTFQVTTLATSTGRVAFAETRPGATTHYVGVNDGTSLYLIDTSYGVTVLNNVAIATSSVANPSVITTSTAHNLQTGNKVYITGHTGSTPDINGSVAGTYTVTVINSTSFSIPVNVTVGGTGGTLGVFPATNTGDLEYMDGYWVVAKSDGTIWNCDVDNPLVWDPTKYITAQMYGSSLVGLARNNNYLFALGTNSYQAFYDGNNANGSFLTNAESAVQQIGCLSNDTVAHEENSIYWVGISPIGGYTVWNLDGTANLTDIGTPALNRMFLTENWSSGASFGFTLRVAGKFFYVLSLYTSQRTFVYDPDIKIWVEWASTTGTTYPICSVSYDLKNHYLIGQDQSNGYLYDLTDNSGAALINDNGGAFQFLARTKRFDSGNMKRKFCTSLDLIGDTQSSTTNVNVQYSDDDYVTTSTARTLDMSVTRPFAKAWGNFRRRSWQVSYTGANPCRLVGIEIVYSTGDS